MRASGGIWTLVVAALLVALPVSAEEGEASQEESPTPPVETESAASTEHPDEGEAGEEDPAAPPAQDEPAGSDSQKTEGVEEIVVMGVRLEDTLQDAPVSATSFSAEELDTLRVQNISDLADFTPNLEINTAFAASNPTLFIRGIGLKDYNANAAGAVAVYQDGIYINSPAGQLFQIFDVESIHVLRGPQGSTNGRNATAGAILVNTFKPDGQWSMDGDFSYGNYNRLEGNGAIGFPIIDEVLSGRVAFTANFADGYVKNDCAGRSLADPTAGGPTPNVDLPCFDVAFPEPLTDLETGKRIQEEDGDCDPTKKPAFGGCPYVPRVFDVKRRENNTKNWATRGLLRWQPTDTQDWLFNFHWGQNRSDSFHSVSCGLLKPSKEVTAFDARLNCIGSNAANWQRPLESGIRTGFYDIDGREELDLLGTSLTLNWNLAQDLGLGDVPWAPASFISITGYEENERKVKDEGDACPCRLFAALWKDEAWQVSQELRFESAGDNYSWVAGGYFLYEEVEADNFYINGTQTDFEQFFDQTMWNFAPFASLRYDFVNADNERPWLYGLSLEGGIRYNWEKKDFTLLTDIFTKQVKRNLALRAEESVGDTWTGVTGDVTLSYAPVEGLTTYAKYARGMKGGHFNAGATNTEAIIDPVDPEFIDSVELGAKGDFFDGLLRFNAAVFRYWYEDLQVFDVVNEVDRPPTQQLLNSDANVWGAELEFSATPLPGLFVRGGGGWLDTEFVDFTVTKRVRPPPEGPNPGGPQDETFDYSGNPLIAAPDWTASGLVEYELPLPGDWGSIVPQFDFSWKDEHFTDPSKASFKRCEGCEPDRYKDGILSQSAYWLFNARLAYRWSDRYEIAGWVQNFTDEKYLVDSFDLYQGLGMVSQIYGRPRTYGFTVSTSF